MHMTSIRARAWAAAWSALACGAAWGQPADDAKTQQRGKRLFLQCAACHEVAPGALTKIGPNLKDVVGRPVGSVAGYSYSAALKGQSFVWDEAHLDKWLQRPTAVAPGTAMAFAGVPDEAERRALIAYLRTLK